MKVLSILGICIYTEDQDTDFGRPEAKIKLKPEFEWFLSNECNEILNN